MSERITENLTKKIFISKWYDEKIIEEQKSQNPIIDKLWGWWSKWWDGKSKPEFIIKFPNSDSLIVIECKPYINQHESKNKDKLKDFAVDGVLYYGAKLSREFNVIAIAISGQNKKELKITDIASILKLIRERIFIIKEHSKYSLNHPDDIDNIIRHLKHTCHAIDPNLVKERPMPAGEKGLNQILKEIEKEKDLIKKIKIVSSNSIDKCEKYLYSWEKSEELLEIANYINLQFDNFLSLSEL